MNTNISRGLIKAVILSLLINTSPQPGRAGQGSENPPGNAAKPIEASKDYVYEPAILRLTLTRSSNNQPSSSGSGRQGKASDPLSGARLDLILIPSAGEPIGRTVPLTNGELVVQLRNLYKQLARQEPLNTQTGSSPARQLYDVLIRPLESDIQRLGINTLVIAADPGLQAIPFAALHDGNTFLGTRIAFSLTPSLTLTPLDPPARH